MHSEVLAPAGSLDHALWALEGGADAVYFGMKKFSARSHAENFSLDDVAALTAVAKTKGAQVFCAMNTVVGEEELVEAVSLAWQLYFAGVDAFILQDIGLALALKRHGPPVHRHASTQAAAHNAGGVAAVKALGFSRVILARENTMTEIAAMVKADPAMEYEVFVHGALCYAVSGNCMASGVMIGRSANRGDCGQVCRTKFELDYMIPGPERATSPHEAGLPDGIHAPPGEVTWKEGIVGSFASMHDLELGSRIRELQAVGVGSFKIEGRMKPPAYSYNTARAYRTFLDGGHDEEAWDSLDEARERYGRLPSAGWFDGHKALSQINPDWAGTLGMPLGVVVHASGNVVTVQAASRKTPLSRLSRGDGVMILGTTPGQVFRGALSGPSVPASGTADISLSDKIGFKPDGGTVWLISRHDGKLPVKKAGRAYRHPFAFTVEVDSVPGAVRLTVSTKEWGGFRLAEELPAEQAHGGRDLREVLAELFEASDSSLRPGQLTVEQRAGAVFVQPKRLKEFRRRWYALAEQKAEEFIAHTAALVREQGRALTAVEPPARATLSPRSGVNRLTGFVVEWDRLSVDQLASTPWGLALPLAPFVPDEEGYLARLRTFLTRLRDDGVTDEVFLGLNNPCHLSWVRRLREEGFALSSWFVDWGFHASNPWTAAHLGEVLPGLAFAVPWLEDPALKDHSYFPPLFTSRACMLRSSFGAQSAPSVVPTTGPQTFDSRAWLEARAAGRLGARPAEGGPRCPAGCAGHFSARLTQGKRGFRVEARDCVNYLILEE